MRPVIINLGWFLTEHCNLKCKHCSVSETDNPCYQGDLGPGEIMKAIHNVVGWGVRHIHFLGGEPTLRSDFPDILAKCKELGIEASFNTNGQLIDGLYAEHLVRNQVQAVTFSLDGPNAETNDFIRGPGTFQKTLHAIQLLKDARSRENKIGCPIISLEIGVNKVWIKEIAKMKSLLLSINPESVYLEATQAEGRALVNKDAIVLSSEELLKEMPGLTSLVSSVQNKIPINFRFFPKWVEYGNKVSGSSAASSDHLCNAFTPQSYVTGDGKVLPCTYSPKVLGWDGVPDVRYSTLDEICSSPHFRGFIRLWKEGVKNTSTACRACGYRHFMCEVCPIAPLEEREFGTRLCSTAMARIAAMKQTGI